MLERVSAREIMTTSPVTIPSEALVVDAARIMAENDVGSLIVVDHGAPVGIITERDLVVKVLAKNNGHSPVRDVMSSPVVTIGPETDVFDAARKMLRLGIRRLAVTDGTRLVGIVTERDLLAVSPTLIEATSELDRVRPQADSGPMQGKCDGCSTLSDRLMGRDGLLLCEDCLTED